MHPEAVSWTEAGRRLADGQIGVVPTDTLYGVVGSALKPAVIDRIYALRQRELDKPLIVLIGSWDDLGRLGVVLTPEVRALTEKVWPGPVSVIVPVVHEALSYLHRGTNSIAFRMPAKPALRTLLQAVGPLVAPSANLAGEPAATTPDEAHEYFGEDVFYMDEGRLDNSASVLVDARFNPPRVLRPAPGFRLQ